MHAHAHTHACSHKIYHVSSWMGSMCLLCYATISKLMLSNYNGVGRHNSPGKQNVWLVDLAKTGCHLLITDIFYSPIYCRDICGFQVFLSMNWGPHCGLCNTQTVEPCSSEGLQYRLSSKHIVLQKHKFTFCCTRNKMAVKFLISYASPHYSQTV